MNNREIALIVWSVIFIAWVLTFKPVRSQISILIKMFFAWKLTVCYILMITYITSITFLLYKINLWNISLLKDTIIWTLFSALVLLVNTSKALKDPKFFRDIMLDNLKLVTILEFILNAYVFHIAIELILVPFLMVLVALTTFASLKGEYAIAKKFFDSVLSIIGFILIAYAIYEVTINYNTFATSENLLSFLISPALTVLFVPFLYGIALSMGYEDFFNVCNNMLRNDQSLLKNLKYSIFINCLFNIQKLNKFRKNIRIYEISNHSDMVKEIKRVNQLR